MMKQYTIQDIRDIDKILEYVHDRHFEIDKIFFDKEKKCLNIPISVIDTEGQLSFKFLWMKKWIHPVKLANLVIHNTIAYKFIDEARVGRGDINTIVLENNTTVVIKCGVPVSIRVEISEFLLDLIISDKVIGQKKYFSLSSNRQI